MKNEVDLGLAISACHCTLGHPKSQREIAAYCGCSWQRIQQIEQRALRKIRAALYRNPELEQELREHGYIH